MKTLSFILLLITTFSLAQNRPQTPKPPFPYKSDSVLYQNADKSITFGGTLTYPEGKGKFPAAIMITGSGAQDRDETLFGHKSFAIIADYLTRQGYAILRVDDRGVGKTTGKGGTSADFKKDLMAGMAFLKTKKFINKKKIGLIGHSEGGMIAPMVAVQSKDVAFIISLAGPAMKITELMQLQYHSVYMSNGIKGKSLEVIDELSKVLFETAALMPLETDNSDTLKKFAKNYYNQMSQDKKEALIESVATNFINQNATVFGGYEWFRYFLKYDPNATISQLKIPVLALNGEKDYQVPAKPNLEGFDNSLKKAGNKKYKIVEMKGLNHLFQKCKACTGLEYGALEESFSTDALKIMGDWLGEWVK